MKVPLLDLKGQYQGMREEIRAAIDEVCDSQYFILGPRVDSFEKSIASYCGTEHALGLSSGTDALLVALMALGIGPGDAVITTPYTFFATYGSIARLGATPISVDIDPVTFNIDPQKCRETIESMPARFSGLTPKVIMPVHLYGQCADMTAIKEIASEYDLKIVEDCAQAIGAEYPCDG
jgi:dTDP-4-amino-4,6-dideoxygalactose transaminase